MILNSHLKRTSTLLLLGIIAPLLNTWAAPRSEFDVAKLSDDGRNAYQKLLNVRLFAIGGVGFGAQTSTGELALHVLLNEKEATAALKSLVHDATPEGSLYGLLGLRLSNLAVFKVEVENYQEPPERNSSPLIKFKSTLKGEL
jgi:hypothetical protein